MPNERNERFLFRVRSAILRLARYLQLERRIYVRKSVTPLRGRSPRETSFVFDTREIKE
jgi:hypothetical protein